MRSILLACALVATPAVAQNITTYMDSSGNRVFVTPTTPLPTSGGGSGGSGAVVANGVIVSGDQTYVVGANQPLNMTATGRLKVGLSSASNITPAAQPATTTTADLISCRYLATPATWADTWTGAVRCNNNGAIIVDGSAVTQPVSETPSAAATSAIVPSTALNSTALLAKAAPGNLFGATITASTAAGFLIVANLSAIPASGTALTAAQVLYCVPIAANAAGTAGSTGIPDRATVGIVLLFSTACATYTPVTTAALHMRIRTQ